jgi:rubrerythrin
MKEAIETAIKMETDAIAFYQEAAQKTQHPFGREMFRGFVKDETRHLKMLESVFKGLNVQFEFIHPKDSIKTVFTELKGEMMQRVEALADEKEALNVAMRFEKEGYDYYRAAASKSGSEVESELFTKLAEEENEHYSILNETYNFLDNTGHWYMYEERGILEG